MLERFKRKLQEENSRNDIFGRQWPAAPRGDPEEGNVEGGEVDPGGADLEPAKVEIICHTILTRNHKI